MYRERDKIIKFCKEFSIDRYTVNPDGSIDVNQDVHIDNNWMEEIPIKFNIVYGNFRCDHNRLSSLYNSPRMVSGNFLCNSNCLTSLEFSPEVVYGNFCCTNNPQLKNLIGSPKQVDKTFECDADGLQFTFEGITRNVKYIWSNLGQNKKAYNYLFDIGFGPEHIFTPIGVSMTDVYRLWQISQIIHHE